MTRTLEYQDAFSWVVRNHNIKIGGDLTHLGVTDTLPFNSIGTAIFSIRRRLLRDRIADVHRACKLYR